MDKGICEHFCHSIILFVFLCMGMKFLLKQSTDVASTRSSVIAAVAFVYMVMFGHNFPPKGINPYLK